jgi:hypothetical protein
MARPTEKPHESEEHGEEQSRRPTRFVLELFLKSFFRNASLFSSFSPRRSAMRDQ